jgi:hypothetical protein
MSKAHRSGRIVLLGRAGMICYGAVHVIVAYLALRVATGGGGQQANHNGALEEVASTSLGVAVLWVLGIGLIAFALWQLLLTAVGYTWRNKKRTRVFKRIGALVRAVTGIVVAVAAIQLASGDGSSGNSNAKQQTLTAKVLELPAGRLLVGLVALIVIGFGVAGIVSGVRRSFMKDLDTSELPAGTQHWVRRLGTIGYPGKGLAVSIIGMLLGLAAIRSNPGEAGGLDAALRTLAAQPFGTFLLIAVAIGFAAYGIFCFAAARSHRSP